MASTDRIEKRVTLRAPVSRVWRAIADAQEFGRWFGLRLEGAFVEGKAIRGTFDGALDEAAIVDHQKSLGLRPSKVRLPGENAVGFDRVPARRRERAFRMNEGGWAAQAENLEKYVEAA
jgi:uncharacterized protein YndB with AHSA1/START domain